jgi:hypothetical protein
MERPIDTRSSHRGFSQQVRDKIDVLRARIARRISPPRRKIPLWEQRQALIDSTGQLSQERRAALLKKAANKPGLEDSLRKGDALFEQWKTLLSSEVSGAGRPAGNADC